MKKQDAPQSQFLKLSSDIFQTPFTSILVLQTTLHELLTMLQTPSLQDFILQFLDDIPSPISKIQSTSFIEISQISLLTLGKKPAFNQSKRYYIALANRVVAIFIKVREILQQTLNDELSQKQTTLIHLSWNYALYQNFLSENAYGDQFLGLRDIILMIFGSVPNQFELCDFNKRLGQFLLKWRYILSRIFNEKIRFIELVNKLLDTNQLKQIEFNQIHQSQSQILKYFDFNEVRDLCEMVLIYVMPLKQLCFLNALDFLKSFIDQAKTQLEKLITTEGSLDHLLTLSISSDLRRYLQNVQSITEPEMYSILLNLMLNGKILFFDEQTFLDNIQLFQVNINELIEGEPQFADVQGKSIEQILNFFLNFQDFIDIQVNSSKKIIRTSLQSKQIRKLLNQEFSSYSGANIFDAFFDLIYKFYAKLSVLCPNTQFSIIYGLKNYMQKLTGKHYNLSKNTKHQNQINDDIMIMEQKQPNFLSQESQINNFGKIFESEADFSNYVKQIQAETLEIETNFELIQSQIGVFSTQLKSYANQNQIEKFDQISSKNTLESQIKASEYLLTMMKKSTDQEQIDVFRVVKYFENMVKLDEWKNYDEEEICAIEEIIAEFEFKTVNGVVKSTNDSLIHILKEVLGGIRINLEGQEHSIQERITWLDNIRDEYYLAKTIPLHQFEKIDLLCKIWAGNFKTVFTAGQMVDLGKERSVKFKFEQLDHLLQRLKDDSQELMKQNDEAERSLFYVLCVLILLNFEYEYATNGLIILLNGEFIDL